jgi:sirohydrochlorin cobaltochelatase
MSHDTVLLIGHGSREPSGNEEFISFAEEASRHLGSEHVESCFVELAEPLVPEGLDRCVERGARRVIALPVILFAAGHVKVEIALELDRAKARHPEVEFLYGSHLGLHPLLIEACEERLAELDSRLSGSSYETAVLVVGRGSSDPDASSDLYKLGRLLWESKCYPLVEVCFIGVTAPSLPEGLERCLALGARRIFVLPYFLFTGVLVPRINRLSSEFASAHPDIDVRVGEHLGNHPGVFKVLAERKAEARDGKALMNCALCRYRVRLPGHANHVLAER